MYSRLRSPIHIVATSTTCCHKFACYTKCNLSHVRIYLYVLYQRTYKTATATAAAAPPTGLPSGVRALAHARTHGRVSEEIMCAYVHVPPEHTHRCV